MAITDRTIRWTGSLPGAKAAAWSREHDAHWIAQRLQAAGVAAGVVLHESELLRDRHLDHRRYWQSIEHPETGTQQHVGRLWRASDTPHPGARHAPMLGQDNEYVYREILGFSDEEYRAFAEAGHIGTEYDASVP